MRSHLAVPHNSMELYHQKEKKFEMEIKIFGLFIAYWLTLFSKDFVRDKVVLKCTCQRSICTL